MNLPITAYCAVCGEGFYASPYQKRQGWGKYCSRACYGTVRSQPRLPDEGWLSCKGCGVAFRQKPTSIRNGKAKSYCSPECRGERVEIVCAQCGAVRKVYRSLGRMRFCSQECVAASKTQKVAITCIVCGKEVKRKRSYFSKRGSGSFCSMQCKAQRMSNTQLTTGGADRNSAKGGKREDLGGQYFRSGWEANYARYLNWLVAQGQISKWEFEPDTFEFHAIKRGSRFYTPDFKVFEKDGSYAYHEVKGWMDSRSRTKLKRMAKYYPQETIVLIDAPVYKALAKQVKALIPNWEGA